MCFEPCNMKLQNLKSLLILMGLFAGYAMCEKEECTNSQKINAENLSNLSKLIIPSLEGKVKGDAGKIGVIGGSEEYTGAPYFAAITALKIGADLVYVITTKNAAPVIKSYSPDLIVYPYLHSNNIDKINNLLPKMDVIVIGPGLGREEETMKLLYEIIEWCRSLKKPLVIDADGLYGISKNLSVLKDYPSPGAVLTPNHRESQMLQHAIGNTSIDWYNFFGNYVSILAKGKEDIYLTSQPALEWSLTAGGSGRRVGGQGDILSGTLATFYGWALRKNICDDKEQSLRLAQSIAAFSAAKFTRTCNARSFEEHGRSMTASDMLKNIHFTFDNVFVV